MRIEVPLSPLDGENAEIARQVGKSLDETRIHPHARIQQVNASTPHSTIRSFCLERTARTPLSDLTDKNASHLPGTKSGKQKLSSQDEFRLREQGSSAVTASREEEEQTTPTLVTGLTPGSAKKRHSRHAERIESLERELASLKDFVVELDGEKRETERLLEEEKEARMAMAKEFALREGAMQNRIRTLQGMLKMVSMEKERLISYGSSEQLVGI